MKKKGLLALAGSICLIVILAALPFMGACAQPAPTPTPTPTPMPTPTPTPAPPPPPEYPSKEITWIIPYAAGGGFDVTSRYFAATMQFDLGEVIVIVNKPGAGGKLAWTMLDRVEPDGYTIGIYNIPGGYVAQLVTEGAEFDFTTVKWIGTTTVGKYILVVGKDSPYQSLEDLQKAPADKPTRIPSIATGATSWIMQMLIAETFGIPYTNIYGYGGSPPALLAVTRGEGDWRVASTTMANDIVFIDRGDVIPILMMDTERDPRWPDVPAVSEIGHPELVLEILFSVGAPPGTPDDVVQVLRDSFARAMKHPDVIKRFEDAGTIFLPLTGEETAAKLKVFIPLMDKYADLFREMMK